jgi:RimJ/RimL family protein N-acetyltransferase
VAGPGDRAPASAVRLVPYDERFLDLSWEWLQDEEMRRLTMGHAFSREQQREWFAGLPQRTDYIIWGVERDGRPIGACGIKGIEHGVGEYWSYIGDKTLWGGGIGTTMMNTAIERAKERGLRRLEVKVSRENERAIRLSLRCGYAHLDDDERNDEQALWMERVL